jgi:DNA-binding transcriptional ArsR family regulator/uncharacterized protein YndB with AHSA1/START domain
VETYGHGFAALGDPTRRAIFERLRAGPRSVGELARSLPVSRPAVSQHLRVLREAGLVSDRKEGTRRLYRVAPEGVAELRAYLDRFWDDALSEFKERVEGGSPMTTQAQTEAIRKSVTVRATVERAFQVFTDEITTWFPLATHSYGGQETVEAVFEGRTGGRVYEIQKDGTEAEWAEVVAWEPPSRFVLDWKICPSEVEVRFSDEEGGITRVDLEHRGWERAGQNAEAMRESYDGGWEVVLDAFAARTG